MKNYQFMVMNHVIYAQKTINKLCNISEKHRAYKIDIDNHGK